MTDLSPDTTLAEIARDEQLQKQLTELILANGARAAMSRHRLSYDRADGVAEGVYHGVQRRVVVVVNGRVVSSHTPMNAPRWALGITVEERQRRKRQRDLQRQMNERLARFGVVA